MPYDLPEDPFAAAAPLVDTGKLIQAGKDFLQATPTGLAITTLLKRFQPSAKTEAKADPHLEQALQSQLAKAAGLVQAKKFTAAESLLKQVNQAYFLDEQSPQHLDKNSKNYPALLVKSNLLRAEVFLGLGNSSRALEVYQKVFARLETVLASDPKNTELFALSAITHQALAELETNRDKQLFHQAHLAMIQGHHAEAQLKLREFVEASPGKDPELNRYRDAARRILRSYALGAVAKLSLQNAGYPHTEQAATAKLLTQVQAILHSGQADTLEAALRLTPAGVTYLEADLGKQPVVAQGYSWVLDKKDVSEVRIAGGTLEVSARGYPATCQLKFGPQGGYLKTADGKIFRLMPSVQGHELTLNRGTIDVSKLVEGKDYLQDKSFGKTAQTPNAAKDEIFAFLLKMETKAGLEKSQGPGARDYLLTAAKHLRAENAPHLAGELLEEFFHAELQQALAAIKPEQIQQIKVVADIKHPALEKQLQEQLERQKKQHPEAFARAYPQGWPSQEQFHGMVAEACNRGIEHEIRKLAFQKIDGWKKSGWIFEKDPLAKEAWELYENMLNPCNWSTTLSDEEWNALPAQIVQEAAIAMATVGVGSLVSAGLRSTRAVRALLAATAEGSAAEFGIETALWGTRVTAEGAVMMKMSGEELSLKNLGHNMLTMAIFHGGGKLWHSASELLAVDAASIQTAKAFGQSTVGKQVIQQLGAIATPTAISIGTDIVQGGDVTAKTALVHALKMAGFHFAGIGFQIITDHHFTKIEQGAQLEVFATRAARPLYQAMTLSGVPHELAKKWSLATVQGKAPTPEVMKADELAWRKKNSSLRLLRNPAYSFGLGLLTTGGIGDGSAGGKPPSGKPENTEAGKLTPLEQENIKKSTQRWLQELGGKNVDRHLRALAELATLAPYMTSQDRLEAAREIAKHVTHDDFDVSYFSQQYLGDFSKMLSLEESSCLAQQLAKGLNAPDERVRFDSQQALEKVLDHFNPKDRHALLNKITAFETLHLAREVSIEEFLQYYAKLASGPQRLTLIRNPRSYGLGITSSEIADNLTPLNLFGNYHHPSSAGHFFVLQSQLSGDPFKKHVGPQASIALKIFDPTFAQEVHLAFLAEYKKTGNFQKTVEWLKKSVWVENRKIQEVIPTSDLFYRTQLLEAKLSKAARAALGHFIDFRTGYGMDPTSRVRVDSGSAKALIKFDESFQKLDMKDRLAVVDLVIEGTDNPNKEVSAPSFKALHHALPYLEPADRLACLKKIDDFLVQSNWETRIHTMGFIIPLVCYLAPKDRYIWALQRTQSFKSEGPKERALTIETLKYLIHYHVLEPIEEIKLAFVFAEELSVVSAEQLRTWRLQALVMMGEVFPLLKPEEWLELVPHVTKLMEDPNPRVRDGALQLLKKMGYGTDPSGGALHSIGIGPLSLLGLGSLFSDWSWDSAGIATGLAVLTGYALYRHWKKPAPQVAEKQPDSSVEKQPDSAKTATLAALNRVHELAMRGHTVYPVGQRVESRLSRDMVLDGIPCAGNYYFSIFIENHHLASAYLSADLELDGIRIPKGSLVTFHKNGKLDQIFKNPEEIRTPEFTIPPHSEVEFSEQGELKSVLTPRRIKFYFHSKTEASIDQGGSPPPSVEQPELVSKLKLVQDLAYPGGKRAGRGSQPLGEIEFPGFYFPKGTIAHRTLDGSGIWIGTSQEYYLHGIRIPFGSVLHFDKARGFLSLEQSGEGNLIKFVDVGLNESPFRLDQEIIQSWGREDAVQSWMKLQDALPNIAPESRLPLVVKTWERLRTEDIQSMVYALVSLPNLFPHLNYGEQKILLSRVETGLEDKDPEVRAEVTSGLKNLIPHLDRKDRLYRVRKIEGLLKEKYWRVRANAVKALGDLLLYLDAAERPAVLQNIRACCLDEHETVRAMAADVLAHWPTEGENGSALHSIGFGALGTSLASFAEGGGPFEALKNAWNGFAEFPTGVKAAIVGINGLAAALVLHYQLFHKPKMRAAMKEIVDELWPEKVDATRLPEEIRLNSVELAGFAEGHLRKDFNIGDKKFTEITLQRDAAIGPFTYLPKGLALRFNQDGVLILILKDAETLKKKS